jgi:hypothetical protein
VHYPNVSDTKVFAGQSMSRERDGDTVVVHSIGRLARDLETYEHSSKA